MASEIGAAEAKRQSQLGAVKSAPVSAERGILLEISTKLDRIVAVLASQGKDRERQIEILEAADCDSALIGAVVGLTASAVRGLQHRRRSKGTSPSAPQRDAPVA